MIVKSATVKSAGKAVAEVEFNHYETVAEAVDKEGGEANILSLINSMVKTNAMNLKRGEFNKKPSKAEFRVRAEAKFAELPTEEILPIATVPGKMSEWLDQKVLELEAEYESDKKAQIEKLAQDEANQAEAETEQTEATA